MKQKYILARRLRSQMQQYLEEQLDIWEQGGYDRNELYHIMHRELMHQHIRYAEEQDKKEDRRRFRGDSSLITKEVQT